MKMRFEDRKSMSDAEFVDALAIEKAEEPIAIIIRKVIAARCGADPEKMHPGDDTDMLAVQNLHWYDDGWDGTEFLISLEETLGTQIDLQEEDLPRFETGRFFWKVWPGAASFGDWVSQVAPMIHGALKAGQPGRAGR